ncbi:MAG TPA: hypothetical protein DDY49_06340 [Paenibacillaceae bacterium]|nr:hypothetical protein [Paenibacillaceae bacterium]
MKPHKIFYSLSLLVLIGFVMVIYNAFNGNPISKYYATKTLEKYVKENYPDKKLQIDHSYYSATSSKNPGYVFEVTEGPKEHQFKLCGTFNFTIFLDTIKIENSDETFTNKLEKEATKEIQSLLTNYVKPPFSVSVTLVVRKDQVPPNSNWSKDMKMENFSIHVSLASPNIKKEDLLKNAKTIQAALNEHGYPYNEVILSGSSEPEGDNHSSNSKFQITFKKDTQLQEKDIITFNF